MNKRQFFALFAFCACAAFLGSLIGGTYLAPRPSLAQTAPLGNGAPTLCDGTTIVCSTGIAGLNLGNADTWTATQTFPNVADLALSTTAGTLVCTSGATQLLTTTGCASSGGGDTITSPNSTLNVGGTSSATTLDVNPAHTMGWTANQTNTAQFQAVGAGGANACSGSKYPTIVYGICLGANNGSTNTYAMIIGPQSCDFNASACSNDSSAKVSFWDGISTGAVDGCDQYYDKPNYGAMTFTCNVHLNGALVENTGSASNGGTCTLASSTSCTVTVRSFNTAVCVTGNNTSPTAVKWSNSGGTITLSEAAASSDTLSVWCWGVY